MKHLLLFFVVITSLHVHAVAQKIGTHALTCEHRVDPIGIDDKAPRLSWQMTASDRVVVQSAYTIRVATDISFSKNAIVWETAKINSDQSLLVPYAGKELSPGTRYYWQVKIWDGKNHMSAWSEAAYWETGLMQTANWKAEWIEPDQDTAKYIPALNVRKTFSVTKKVRSARAYVTAHGLYELHLNGKKVGDQLLTPGWTSYNKRLQYQVYDITAQLQQGNNAVGAVLGDGWYRGTLAWANHYGVYGKTLGLLCQLEITYVDGTKAYVVTDTSWKGTQTGPIVMDGIYFGESYDARKELTGWSTASYGDGNWKPVHVAATTKDNIISDESVAVKRIQELKPVKIFKTPNGTLVADMGQNMVGWIRLKVSGKAGTVVTIRHAEVLDKQGEFYTDNLRSAEATMRYTLKGTGTEIYEPRFTFFGFRYISIDGFPGEVKPENLTGVVIHSAMQPTGTFECSNPLINQLQHNIQWGQKGNFVDVPTDCPQRDERLGWTGDAQAFCRTAAFNMDVASFFTKWLKDVAADQYKNGSVPFVIPNVLDQKPHTSAGWGDVSTIAPWTMYTVYGDKDILATQYPSMKAYVEYIRSVAGETHQWKGGSVFGDWLYYKPEMNHHTEPDGYTNPDMIATMFYAYSTKLLSQAAGVLGNTKDQKMYADLFLKIKNAFIKEYVSAAGRIASDSQTSYVLALEFDLLPAELKQKAADYLVDDIKRRKNHLSTGFLGTPYLCHVLSDNGHLSTSYDLLLQETFPSWLYPVKMGATTIWERWDGQKPDSTFQDVGMNSFNHYAYGAVGDWMYRVVAGIEIGKAGYKHILIQPRPDKRLTHAKATFESGYGQIVSGWEMKGDQMTLTIKIPANTTASITLPHAKLESVMEGGKALSAMYKDSKTDGDAVKFEVGSGEYVFQYPYQL